MRSKKIKSKNRKNLSKIHKKKRSSGVAKGIRIGNFLLWGNRHKTPAQRAEEAREIAKGADGSHANAKEYLRKMEQKNSGRPTFVIQPSVNENHPTVRIASGDKLEFPDDDSEGRHALIHNDPRADLEELRRSFKFKSAVNEGAADYGASMVGGSALQDLVKSIFTKSDKRRASYPSTKSTLASQNPLDNPAFGWNLVETNKGLVYKKGDREILASDTDALDRLLAIQDSFHKRDISPSVSAKKSQEIKMAFKKAVEILKSKNITPIDPNYNEKLDIIFRELMFTPSKEKIGRAKGTKRRQKRRRRSRSRKKNSS